MNSPVVVATSSPANDVIVVTSPPDDVIFYNVSTSTAANWNVTTESFGHDNATVAHWSLAWRVGMSAILVVFMVAAIVGNLMVIVVVVRHRGMRTKTNMFLCNLAVVDFLCAIIDMPFSLVTVASGGWIFNDHVCQMNGFMMPFLFVLSIHTLMYIAVYKYASIVDPFGRGRHPRFICSTRGVLVMIGAAWAWSILAGGLTLSPMTAVGYKPMTSQCGPSYPRRPSELVLFGFFVVTCYAVPVIVVLVCYALVFGAIRRYSLRMRRTTTEPEAVVYAHQRRVAVTLVLLVVMFVVCWTPWTIYAFCSVFVHDLGPFANPIVYWFGYLNSVCNPMIYALRSDAFREGFRQVLTAGMSKKQNADRVVTLSNTPSSPQQVHWRLGQTMNGVTTDCTPGCRVENALAIAVLPTSSVLLAVDNESSPHWKAESLMDQPTTPTSHGGCRLSEDVDTITSSVRRSQLFPSNQHRNRCDVNTNEASSAIHPIDSPESSYAASIAGQPSSDVAVRNNDSARVLPSNGTEFKLTRPPSGVFDASLASDVSPRIASSSVFHVENPHPVVTRRSLINPIKTKTSMSLGRNHHTRSTTADGQTAARRSELGLHLLSGTLPKNVLVFKNRHGDQSASTLLERRPSQGLRNEGLEIVPDECVSENQSSTTENHLMAHNDVSINEGLQNRCVKSTKIGRFLSLRKQSALVDQTLDFKMATLGHRAADFRVPWRGGSKKSNFTSFLVDGIETNTEIRSGRSLPSNMRVGKTTQSAIGFMFRNPSIERLDYR